MQKGVFIITYIDKGRIQPGNNFLDCSQINVTYGEFASLGFLVEFYERLIF
jgi:hypothetical protein